MHIEQHLDEEKPEGAENEAVEQVAPPPQAPGSGLVPPHLSRVSSR